MIRLTAPQRSDRRAFHPNIERLHLGRCVGTLSRYLKGLREVSDVAFHEGEHAA
jgi:hypothetical protein